MGVITLGLIAYGSHTDTTSVPFWVKVACAVAIASGTYLGGWRIIRTLSKGLVEITRPQGMAADGASTAVILTASHLGVPLSTTQVASGSILGSGVGRPRGTRALECGRTDGDRVGDHAAGRRFDRRVHVVAGPHDWRTSGRAGGDGAADLGCVVDVLAIAPRQGRPPQRQRDVEGTKKIRKQKVDNS
jgi:phosphate/sulfate permease